MLNKENIILVTGATGAQGGAVAKALLKNENTVRIIVRKASRHSKAAEELEKAGAEIVTADMEDPASLEAALKGVYSLFSVQDMDNGTDSERRHATNLLTAAFKAGVLHVVHASVNQTGNHLQFRNWDKWNKKYWLDKQFGEDILRNAGFKYWTILRPVFFMDNFITPKVTFMFPDLAKGEIVTAWDSNAKLQLIAVDDTGAFAAAAFNNPEKFNEQIIDLAGDELTIGEIAQSITSVTGKNIHINYVSEAEAVQKGLHPAFANVQIWNNEIGYNADIQALKAYGLPVTNFSQYLEKNKSLLPL
ncbi:MAG: putative nucleoside-diphosphate sugar epimerase [Mucilaginibacter sp.]|nr:putative nucleoside-diphosphate sugar epimerase [Mucilaginibacter sp.]